jgi:hypothetical protein
MNRSGFGSPSGFTSTAPGVCLGASLQQKAEQRIKHQAWFFAAL